MNIPVAKPFLGEEEAKAAHDVVLTHWVTQGPKVKEFEDNFARYTGAQYAVAVSNCTTGLHLAMLLCHIGSGDEVICPSLSYIATANSIVHAGANPIFAEVRSDYNLDPDDAEKRITPKTKAILVVHQIGMPADIDRFRQICDNHGLFLIEDAACAAGSSYKDKKIGSHSDLVVFSFHPRKVITTGDGGMITTSRKDLADRARLLRQHGMSVNDRVRHEAKTVIIEDHVEVGYNYRMTDIQAAVGIEQLKRLDWLIEERRRIAQKYTEAFAEIPHLRLPVEPESGTTNYQSYSIYLEPGFPVERNELMQRLLDRGISTRRGVMNSHRATAYKHLNLHLPFSEDLEDRSIILPLYVPMPPEEVQYVIEAFRGECMRTAR
jgi:dTDP-4-amino-4,6-dideoxygalactose transaminase